MRGLAKTGRGRGGARKRVPRIPSGWFRLAPGKPMSFWLRVERKVKSRGVRKRDMEAVRRIVESM